MTPKKDPEIVAQEVLSRSEKMIAEARQLLQQSDNFYREIGINRGRAKTYLHSDKVPKADRGRLLQELEDWKIEVEADILKEQEHFKLTNLPAGVPAGIKKGRVMI
jgi:hypothetical protein